MKVMGALANTRNFVVLLLLSAIVAVVAALAVGSVATAPATQVTGEFQSLGIKLDIKTADDEIDPEACLIFIEKELQRPEPLTELEFKGNTIIREQEIIKVISACNVDDPIRPPNLERELDVDIEIFSVRCDKDVALNRDAVCVVERVAQEEDLIDDLVPGSGDNPAAAQASAPEPEPEPAP